jgi:uncharacterized Zn-binding protein involved in type VI secretion
MKLPAVRVGDMTTGHGPYPPQAAFEGSSDVLINGKSAMRQFDDWDPHCCPSANICHDGTVVEPANKSVFINGSLAVRIGDYLDCGSVCETGSSNVFIGGE